MNDPLLTAPRSPGTANDSAWGCGPAWERPAFLRAASLGVLLLFAAVSAVVAQPAPRSGSTSRSGDYIVAVVNQELVTAGELDQRIVRIKQSAARARSSLPPDTELRQQVLDAMIEERVQITWARESGIKIDDGELDRAVANVAQQNQLTLAQLRERLRTEGIDIARFRKNIRDQLLVERVREREVNERIKISDAEIDAQIERERAKGGAGTQLNIAQILVAVPEGASDAVVAERQARAQGYLARVRGTTDFITLAREVSDDANKAQGGVIGLRPASRLPDIFVDKVRGLKEGEVAPALLRTSAGFHLLKLLEKRESDAFTITQTRARHILLRLSPQLSAEAAVQRLAGFKREIESARRTFEALARENSEDGSAERGGDLGWQAPGSFVPEFEDAMNALAISGLSDPVVSRFGVHLIQVTDRRQVALDAKQQREQARNVLREQKFEAEYGEWLRELRARAYVEMREPPN